MRRVYQIGIVGNPNSGKTSLFNALTSSSQEVGNWPGVTVERVTGVFNKGKDTITCVDLPGIYALLPQKNTLSQDERITADFLEEHSVDLIVNVIDASTLERNLYLTIQLREMQIPLLLVVNKMDMAKKKGIQIDLEQLSQRLGCPVIGTISNTRNKQTAVQEKIVACLTNERGRMHTLEVPYSLVIKEQLEQIRQAFDESKRKKCDWRALRFLEGDMEGIQSHPSLEEKVHRAQQIILETTQEETDILMADARYRLIETIQSHILSHSFPLVRVGTHCLDQIVLHRIFGIPIFLGLMYLMFSWTLWVSALFQDFFAHLSQAFFIDGVLACFGSSWFTEALANGAGMGVKTVCLFIPVMTALFFALSWLEESGYMARAAIVMDRFMRLLGLPGKSFVPILIGFGCNVPAIMAARTLEHRRDQILTILMSPFISCGARMAVYAIFVATFFPENGKNIVFLLYFLGLILACFTGFILRHTVLKGAASPLIMELPPYHLPSLSTMLFRTWFRLKDFLKKAGYVIVPVCFALSLLQSYKEADSLSKTLDPPPGLISVIGKKMVPIFKPMGIQENNWPAVAALLTGIFSKEVIIGTLNTLYDSSEQREQPVLEVTFSQVTEDIKKAFQSLHQDFLAAFGLSNRHEMKQEKPNKMKAALLKHFDGKTGAFSYVLFVLLYFPCLSVLAVMWQELGWKWTVFSMGWSNLMAYAVGVGFYQGAHWSHPPFFFMGGGLSLIGCVWGVRYRLLSNKRVKSP